MPEQIRHFIFMNKTRDYAWAEKKKEINTKESADRL